MSLPVSKWVGSSSERATLKCENESMNNRLCKTDDKVRALKGLCLFLV